MRSGYTTAVAVAGAACLVVGEVVLGFGGGTVGESAAPHYPRQLSNLLGTLNGGTFSPDTPPPGANRPGCRGTKIPGR